jgi:hypothetical protein
VTNFCLPWAAACIVHSPLQPWWAAAIIVIICAIGLAIVGTLIPGKTSGLLTEDETRTIGRGRVWMIWACFALGTLLLLALAIYILFPPMRPVRLVLYGPSAFTEMECHQPAKNQTFAVISTPCYMQIVLERLNATNPAWPDLLVRPEMRTRVQEVVTQVISEPPSVARPASGKLNGVDQEILQQLQLALARASIAEYPVRQIEVHGTSDESWLSETWGAVRDAVTRRGGVTLEPPVTGCDVEGWDDGDRTRDQVHVRDCLDQASDKLRLIAVRSVQLHGSAVRISIEFRQGFIDGGWPASSLKSAVIEVSGQKIPGVVAEWQANTHGRIVVRADDPRFRQGQTLTRITLRDDVGRAYQISGGVHLAVDDGICIASNRPLALENARERAKQLWIDRKKAWNLDSQSPRYSLLDRVFGAQVIAISDSDRAASICGARAKIVVIEGDEAIRVGQVDDLRVWRSIPVPWIPIQRDALGSSETDTERAKGRNLEPGRYLNVLEGAFAASPGIVDLKNAVARTLDLRLLTAHPWATLTFSNPHPQLDGEVDAKLGPQRVVAAAVVDPGGERSGTVMATAAIGELELSTADVEISVAAWGTLSQLIGALDSPTAGKAASRSLGDLSSNIEYVVTIKRLRLIAVFLVCILIAYLGARYAHGVRT